MAFPRDLNKRSIYLIADHLDRILAAGEDLTRLRYLVHSGEEQEYATVTALVHQCRKLELGALAALIRARENAEILGRSRNRFETIAKLFVGGTSAILDTVELTTLPQEQLFSGVDPIAFLQSRGLIPDDMGCLRMIEEIAVDEDYLIAGCIHLGSLMDMTAAFLDAIEVHFDLFPELGETSPDLDGQAPAGSILVPG
jgi:hypothetical protein